SGRCRRLGWGSPWWGSESRLTILSRRRWTAGRWAWSSASRKSVSRAAIPRLPPLFSRLWAGCQRHSQAPAEPHRSAIAVFGALYRSWRDGLLPPAIAKTTAYPAAAFMSTYPRNPSSSGTVSMVWTLDGPVVKLAEPFPIVGVD